MAQHNNKDLATGMASLKNDKVRTDRMIGALRAVQKAAARTENTVLAKPVTATGGRSQTDDSPAHKQKKKFTPAC